MVTEGAQEVQYDGYFHPEVARQLTRDAFTALDCYFDSDPSPEIEIENE